MNLSSKLLWLTTFVLLFIVQSCQMKSDKDQALKASIGTTNDELLNKGNLDKADEVFAEGYAGQGPEIIKQMASGLRDAFPDLHVEVDHLVAENGVVAWRRTATGTQQKAFMGYAPISKQISWTDMVITRYDDDGKIAEEWGVSDLAQQLENARSEIDGVYTYLPPLKGQSILRNGRYVFTYGRSDDSSPMVFESGTYTVNDDIITGTMLFGSDTKSIGTSYSWRITSWSGDTVTYEVLNADGQRTGGGRSLRVSH